MKKYLTAFGLLAAGALLLGSGGGALDGTGEFTAEIIAGGVSMGRFTPVEWPAFTVEVIDLADPMPGPKKVPGYVRVSPMVFEMGVAEGDALINWRKEIENSAATMDPSGPVDPKKDGTIILRDDTGAEVARYAFTGGWPSRLEGMSVMRAGYTGRVVDLLELRMDNLTRTQ